MVAVLVGAASVLDMCSWNALDILGAVGATGLNTSTEGDRAAMDFTPCRPALKAEVRTLEAARAARQARDAIFVDRIRLLWL